MSKYSVRVYEVIGTEYEVEATSTEEALRKVAERSEECVVCGIIPDGVDGVYINEIDSNGMFIDETKYIEKFNFKI